MNPQTLVPVILALQFATFGWRINREITLSDEGRRTWLLVSDYVNFASMLAILVFCIIIPLRTNTFDTLSRICLSVGFVMIIFFPIAMAGHYRLFSKEGRSIYRIQGKEVAHVSDQEKIVLAISFVCAILAGYYTSLD